VTYTSGPSYSIFSTNHVSNHPRNLRSIFQIESIVLVYGVV
jgi:hypothetical protein